MDYQAKIGRRAFGALTLGAAVLPLGRQAWAQEYGRLVLPFPPGGPGDAFARMILDNGLGSSIGRKFVIEYKPGAGGTIATAQVAKAAPDGRTLLLTTTQFVQSASLYSKPGYDPVRDFTPILQLGTTPLILIVRADLPAKSLPEFLALAKSRRITYASAGGGHTSHLLGHMLADQQGLNMDHVPYKGEGPAMMDLLSGNVDAGFFAPLSIIRQLPGGKIRPLASAGMHRSAAMPDVPTFHEMGVKGFEVAGWFGVFAPAGLPPAMVQGLAQDIRAALRLPVVRKWLDDNVIRPSDDSAEPFATVIPRDLNYWRGLVKKTGASAD